MSSRPLVLPTLAVLLTGSLHASPEKILNQFLGNYCLECHDAATEKGEREFDSFQLPLEDTMSLITAQEIIDQVTLKEMPPKEADQPSDKERLELVRALRESISEARELIQSSGARTVMRRLSSREYENTLESLFGRSIATLGLTADFPKERTSHHMDNIGASLVTSGFLLDQHFQAAHRLVESRLGRPEMEPQSWHFKGGFNQYEELNGPHKAAFNFRYLCLYEQPNTDTRQGGYGHIEDFLEGVPSSGLYDIQVQAQALHRDTHYDPAIFGIDFSEPFQIGIVPGDVTKGHIHYPQSVEPVLATSLVPDEKPAWLKFRVWLEEGQTPRFIFPNGPYESRASVVQINKRYKDEFKGKVSSVGVSRTHLLREGKLPHIRISEIKIRGPLPEEHGGVEEIRIFGPKGFEEKTALNRLDAFAEKAFRRPLSDDDRKRIHSTFDRRKEEGATARQAALDTLKMILCSPSFLYLPEVTPEDERTLRDFDLASRLSYALWAAPPDKSLFDAAKKGALTEPAELSRQVRRMLEDDRSSAFVNGFLDSWLNLRELGNQPPPRASARAYYAEDLPSSMKEEARRFFHHLLEKDGPVADFLDADYSFIDKKLAKLYGLPEKDELRLADGFQRVSLKDNPKRGGLLGMAGVLTVSANGVDTSPVTRGVWVAENILGTPPPPPPDEVPAIGTDVRGAKTIRERLALHSDSKTCAECHRKIDPLGFSLETFDPIGRWRSTYPKTGGAKEAAKVDPSGELPSGETFADFGEFKQVLLAHRKEAFSRNLLSQTLTYATGRHMEAADRLEIDEILEDWRKAEGGLRSLVIAALTSDIFRSR